MSTEPAPWKVGVLLFEDFELLDVFGPLEMLGRLESEVRFLMLAEKAGSIRSNQGPACVADTKLTSVESLDVLLVPGGWGTRREVENPALLAELARIAAASKFVTSVCTGSALLARAGILDGRKATTNKRAFKWVVSQGPRVDWVPEARWVEDGKFFTSSGVSAGMDMALGLVAHLLGRDSAVAFAIQTEYEWHDDKGWDPFAKLNGLA